MRLGGTMLLAALGLAGCRLGAARQDAAVLPSLDAATTDGAGSGGGPVAGCAVMAASPGDFLGKLRVGGADRTYRLHVPSGYRAGAPTPVVLALHGGGSNADAVEQGTGVLGKSEREGFLLVLAEGVVNPSDDDRKPVARTWNSGVCCGTPFEQGVDDVAYFRAVLDDLEARYCVDRERVFAFGYSNGAQMTYRLACQMSDRLAAVAPVAGCLGNSRLDNCLVDCAPPTDYQAKCLKPGCSPSMEVFTCAPSRPVAIMHFHGTADPIAPYNGGTGKSSADLPPRPGVLDNAERFRLLNGCQATKTKTYQSGSAVCEAYGGCATADFVLCTVGGGGHTWPGGSYDILACQRTDFLSKSLCDSYKSLVGPISPDINAIDEMWKFFQAHPSK